MTRGEEKRLVMRIEDCELSVARMLLRSPVTRRAFGQVGDELADGRIKVRELTRGQACAGRGENERAWLEALRDLIRGHETGADQRPSVRSAPLREDMNRAIEGLRPSRTLLDRVVRISRALLPEHLEPTPSPIDERELASLRATLRAVRKPERSAAGARTGLVQANRRLVVSIATGYQHRGVPLLDLIQEGNIGLLKALDRFDYHRGHRLSTYATWLIRQAVTQAVANVGLTIRVPVEVQAIAHRVARTRAGLRHRHSRDATVEEVAEAAGLAPEVVRAAALPSREPLSLETPVGDGGSLRLGDRLEDMGAEDPVETLDRAHALRAVRASLALLTPRERDVLAGRFGLDGESESTLEAIGEGLSLTRERIRQIEAGALEKLRASLRARRSRGGFEIPHPVSRALLRARRTSHSHPRAASLSSASVRRTPGAPAPPSCESTRRDTGSRGAPF
jgi:RNA polymerase primary sigma factor